MSHDVFISHSSTDKHVADAICAALEREQVRCWIAPRDIRPGDSWGGSILDAIEASKVMVVIFSSRANTSKQVMREVERAVKKDVVIVPFRIEKVEPSDDLEYFLSATHWLDAITPEMDHHLAALTTTVKSILGTPPSEGPAAAVTARPSPPAPAPASPVPAPASPAPQPARSWKLPLIGAAALIVLLGVAWILSRSDWPSQTGSRPEATDEADGVLAKDLPPRTEGSIDLTAAATAVAGTELPVSWSGSSASDDYIIIAKADAHDSVSGQRTPVGDGSTVNVLVPDAEGAYEVRYFDAATRNVLARTALAVKSPQVTLDAPPTAQSGSEIQVKWVAPNNKGDYLAIAEKGSEGNSHLSYAYTAKGSPTTLRVPDDAGQYELRYISGGNAAIWKARPIEALRPEVTIAAVSKAVAGSEIPVEWSGPANSGDYVSVARPDMEDREYLGYAYPKPGSAVKLRLPEEAGDYEVRYVSGQTNNIWARRPISVTAPEVSVSIVPSAAAGTEQAVQWTGPANSRDFISVARPSEEASRYASYQYVKAGARLKIRLPDTPGDFEVRYVSGNENHIWATAPITVTEQVVTIERPAGVKAGQDFEVRWSGPGNERDYIAVYERGADINRYLSYRYTAGKSSATFDALVAPGTYELRYVSGQEELVWASVEFAVN